MLKTLDIEPTTICDLNCPFCFGPKVVGRANELSFLEWRDALHGFFARGVENVVISGGEPTLYRELEHLARYVHETGRKLVLSTHGRNRARLSDIARYCSWVALPIDAVSMDLTTKMRTDSTEALSVLDTAHLLKTSNPQLRIKIGTVVTAANFSEIQGIARLLSEHPASWDTWKLYQYTPRRKGKVNARLLQVPDADFDNLRKGLDFLAGKNVVFSSNVSRKDAYLFVYHDGSVNLVNVGGRFSDEYVGSILDFEEIDFERVERTLSAAHSANFERTYGMSA